MKRLVPVFLSAAFFALPGLAGVEGAAYAAQTNFGPAKKTNFKSRSTTQKNQPNRPRTLRRNFDFFGIFAPPPARRNRGVRILSPNSAVYHGGGNRAPQRIISLPPEKPKIYTYPAPKTVSLAAPGLSGNPTSEMATRILDVLRTGKAGLSVLPEHRKAIIAFYKERNFEPVWVSNSGVRERAFDVVALLARAPEEGLPEEIYRLPAVWEVDGNVQALQGEKDRLSRFEVQLTAMALRYARHASGGMVDPNKLSAYHDLKPPRVSPKTALEKLASSANPAAWLKRLLPTHPAYAALKRELKRLSSGPKLPPLPPIATGGVIRPGEEDERIPLIRRYLERAGFLKKAQAEPPVITPASTHADAVDDASGTSEAVTGIAPAGTDILADSTRYDPALVAAIKAFQKKAGLKPDGIIGRRTIARLNARGRDTHAARAAKLRLNMERLRWMPRDFGRVHFLANQPAFEVYLIKDNRTVWKSRIIIGKPTNQTAFFSDEMELVVFNPYWGVPQSIITKEFMPKLLRDPSWLDREGYEIYDRTGRRISSASINWSQYAGMSEVPFDIRQPPGKKNALGHLKFLFPNSHSIYMHDTPARSLFQRKRRAFSHGCVRVQDPLGLAQQVTGLSLEEIKARIASGKNQKMRLKQKIPVHLAYFTAWPDDQGRIRYYADVYGRDKRLQKAMNKVKNALRVPVPEAGSSVADVADY